MKQPKWIAEATSADEISAHRITSMARLPMYRRVLALIVKVRKLESEAKSVRAEQRKQWGWQ